MKRNGLNYLHTIIFTLFISVFSFSVLAQSPKYFIITGKIIFSAETPHYTSIQIVKNNNSAIKSLVSPKGRFRLELDYNSEYKLTFSQEGHIEKTIVVNTEIPVGINEKENFPHFLMAVMLEKIDAESGIQPSDIPVQHISYSSSANNFVRLPGIFDLEYAEENGETISRPHRSNDGKLKMQAYQIF